MSDNNSSGIGTLLAFTAGAVIGAGIALMLAPEEGKMTRGKLKDIGEDYYEKAKEKLDRELKKRNKTTLKGKGKK